MKILIADDDPLSLILLESQLHSWGFEVLLAHDGAEAGAALDQPAPPPLAILDWQMPGLTGLEVCARARQDPRTKSTFIILLTATRIDLQSEIECLNSGADDFLVKPCDAAELHAHVRVAERVVTLQAELTERIRQLEEALANVKTLQGLLPICAGCKKVRDDQNYWHQVERYIMDRTDAKLSHSLCPDCTTKYMEELQRLTGGREP
jgi:DNA-binding response OmpR family regulator